MLAITSMAVGQGTLGTRTGSVHFYSHSPIEDIEASNNQVSSKINTDNGEFAFLVPIKAFEFEKALMQEHFNENYLESDQFPNATFTGTITNIGALDLKQVGEYSLTFKGTMTIHGVSLDFEQIVEAQVGKKTLFLVTEFYVNPEDYEIKIPAGKKDNIAESIKVSVKLQYPLNP